MSFYRFNDTVTLYTPIDEDYYERRVIPAVKVEVADSDEKGNKRATVYIPIYGRRSLKYRPMSEPALYDKSSFTVAAGQKVCIGRCLDNIPPKSAFTVRTAEVHLSGSRHVQHAKITAHNIPQEEDETDE